MGQGGSTNTVLAEENSYLSEYSDHPDASFKPATLKDEVIQMVAGEMSSGSVISSSNSKDNVNVPTEFTWKHGGQDVFVTGTFNQWLGKIAMNKVDTYEFVLRINVPPGKHHYKFIVDDKWKFAPDQPTEMDGEGRVNNVVEVKSIESSAEHLCSTDEDREDDTSYGQTIPMSDEYSTDPPILPPQLGLSLLNASSKSVPFRSESTQALQQLEPTLLPVPQHVTVNHLYLSEKNMAELGDEVLVLGVTQRYKTKYITTVLYKPRQTSNSGSFNIQES